ncbi:hypothetical protein HYX10_02955 [Candidatus Woesearchaeota archaeon]|nr:hypothetical protein [Candidatus Woesearchaeota archaeon]
MADLSAWIRQQLKDGYTKQEIKNAMMKRGYSKEDIAAVDHVSKRKMPLVPAAVALAVVAVAAAFIMALPNSTSEPQITNSVQQEMKPVYIYNNYAIDGVAKHRVELYSGTISAVSLESITLTKGNARKTFTISETKPVQYIDAETRTKYPPRPVKAGDEVTQLFYVVTTEVPYALLAFVNVVG